MRLSVLPLVLLVGACALTAPSETPTAPVSAETAAPAPTADVTLVGYPDGGAEMAVAFRSAAAVPVSPTEPAVVVARGRRHEAAVVSRASSSATGGVVTTSAVYRLDRAGRSAVEAAGEAATLLVHDGAAYRSYRVARPDFLQ